MYEVSEGAQMVQSLLDERIGGSSCGIGIVEFRRSQCSVRRLSMFYGCHIWDIERSWCMKAAVPREVQDPNPRWCFDFLTSLYMAPAFFLPPRLRSVTKVPAAFWADVAVELGSASWTKVAV